MLFQKHGPERAQTQLQQLQLPTPGPGAQSLGCNSWNQVSNGQTESYNWLEPTLWAWNQTQVQPVRTDSEGAAPELVTIYSPTVDLELESWL